MGETARQGFRRRLTETHGVVATDESALGTSLVIAQADVEVPEGVTQALTNVYATFKRPDGEELVNPMQRAAVSRQVSCGFFYRWRWPRGEDAAAIKKWLDVRALWHREVRDKLKYAREFMDSPLLVTKAAIRWHDGYVHVERGHEHTEACYEAHEGVSEEEFSISFGEDVPLGRLVCEIPESAERRIIPPHTRHGPQPTWDSEHWPEWKAIRDTCRPEVEAVWIDDFLVRAAVEWAQQHVGIVWYEHDTFGRAVAELGGLPFYGPGAEASSKILTERGTRSIVASIRAHGTGKNLQCFSRNLLGNVPGDGAQLEQLIARTHRPGQLADEVTVDVFRHTSQFVEDFETAQSRARYIEETTGNKQKLNYATITF